MSVRSTYSVGRANVVVKRYQYARYQRPRTTAMLSSIPGGPSVCEGGVKSKAESPSPALIRFIASPSPTLDAACALLGLPTLRIPRAARKCTVTSQECQTNEVLIGSIGKEAKVEIR